VDLRSIIPRKYRNNNLVTHDLKTIAFVYARHKVNTYVYSVELPVYLTVIDNIYDIRNQKIDFSRLK